MAIVYFILILELYFICFILAESRRRDEKSRIRRYLTWSFPSPVAFTNYGDITVFFFFLIKISYVNKLVSK